VSTKEIQKGMDDHDSTVGLPVTVPEFQIAA